MGQNQPSTTSMEARGIPGAGLRTPLKYLLVGSINTVAGLSVIYLCILALHTSDTTANVAGYAVGFLLSFLLNRNWTFSNRSAPVPQLLRFSLVLSLAYFANLITVWTLTSHWPHNRYIAQAMGILPYTVIGYLGSRSFVFRNHP